jgi:NAD(P)-dependent dehydrogenase (short-subunit alcohol dehydrogenase family)
MSPTPPPTATTNTGDGGKLIIAITGANGMVGQGVTEKALADGHKVIALDIGPTSLRSANKQDGKGDEGRYKYHQLDATDYQAYYDIIKQEGCTAIIHLAATFNKFGEDGELTSNVHSHVSPHSIHPIPFLMSGMDHDKHHIHQ